MKKPLVLLTAATVAVGGIMVAANHANGRFSRVPRNAVESAEIPVDRAAQTAAARAAFATDGDAPSLRAGGMTAMLPVPFEIEPTADDISYFTIIDLNENAGNYDKWKYQSNFKGLVSPSSSSHAEDDWAITPVINFTDATKLYELTFDAYTNMPAPHCGTIEVYVGTADTPEAMTVKIGELRQFSSPKRDERVAFAMPFAVPAAGQYRIGFHCVTDPADCEEPWPVVLQKIAVDEKAGEVGAPQPVIGATAQAAPQGELKATVTFTMPSKELTGNDIPASQTLVATVKSTQGDVVTETKTVSGAPASVQTLDIATAQGDNMIVITVAAGANVGEPAEVPVYTGVVRPMRVQGLTATVPEDNMSMTLTWNAPVAGENDGYVDFDALEYDIYKRDAEGEYQYFTTVGKAKTYTYTVDAGMALHTVALRVLGRNAAGTSTDVINYTFDEPVYVLETLGVPYSMPATEKFDNLQARYTPVRNDYPDEYYGRWFFGDPTEMAEDDNQSALLAYNPLSDGDTRGRVRLPQFSTKGIHSATFTLKYLRYGSNASQMHLYITAYGEELEKLADLDCSQATDWKTETFPLPLKFQDRSWIQIVIDVDLDDYYYMYGIDEYSFSTGAQIDLAVTGFTGDEQAPACSPATFTAEVSNVGFTEISDASVRFDLLDGESVAATETVAVGTMAMGEHRNVNVSFTPAAEYLGKRLSVRATIESESDGQAGNNTSTFWFSVIAPESPVVTDLSASSADNAVTLTWSRPSLAKAYTESFESVAPFAYEGQMGEFDTFDGDGQTVYMFDPAQNPMPNENLPKAFLAVNHSELVNPEGLEAHTGEMYLLATCPEMTNAKPTPDPADDWLISPEVPGGRLVSFWVNIINEKYPENIEVLSSTTGNEPADFTVTLKKMKLERTGWQKVQVALPDDARYFAIHYVSRDMFGILIDDVTYPSMLEPFALTGYNVYRDGVKVASVADGPFTDGGVELGRTYTYTVEALDGDKPYAMSRPVTVVHDNSAIDGIGNATAVVRGVKGGIELTGLAGGGVSVFDMAGRLVARRDAVGQAEILPVDTGIYLVVTDGGIRAKVTVL